MFKKISFLLAVILCPVFSYAADDVYSIEKYLIPDYDDTKCASGELSKALAKNANMIEFPDDASGNEINTWVRTAFAQPDTIQAVLNCDEMKNFSDDYTIVFQPVSYTFPNGRKIDINYESQKQVLRQKLLLANTSLMPSGDPNPDLEQDVAAGAVYVNVDPAWYGILVAEHGSLDEQLKKSPLLSLKYIQDNIKDLYPKDHAGPFRAQCTSASAIAGDTDMINRAVTITVGGSPSKSKKDVDFSDKLKNSEKLQSHTETDAEKELRKTAESNDYYVMGDKDLSWISWTEIASDVILTVVSWGGYAVVKGALTMARGARVMLKARKAMKVLHTSRNVGRWINTSRHIQSLGRATKTIDKASDSYRAISNVTRGTKQTLNNLKAELKVAQAKNDIDAIKNLEKEIEMVEKQVKASEQAMETAEKMTKIEQTLQTGTDISPAKQKRLRELEQQIQKLEQEISGGGKKHSEAEKLRKKLVTAKQERNTIQNQAKLAEGEAEQLTKEMKELKNTYSEQLTKLEKLHADDLAKLEKFDDVKKYKELGDASAEAARSRYFVRNSVNTFRTSRGLLPMRAFKGWRALHKGLKAKKLDKSAKVVRANMNGLSNKAMDWLFHSTAKSVSALGKVPAVLETGKMIVKVAGDMYDYTDTSTGDFTNNIEMKPYLLLAADNLPGYENVINYGMWLFWAGDSTSAADDDAARLESLLFAEKFHQDLVEIQDEYNVMACDVDIYVVRPIIRNPGTENQELYYLFVKTDPWTTHGYNEPNDGSEPSSIPLRETADSIDGNTYDSVAVSDGNGGTIRNIRGIGRVNEPAYDGTKIGQSCTKPSTKAGVFTDTIYPEASKYSAYPAFTKAMITKLRTEGSCGNHPDDAGGYTCYGVSSKFFPEVSKQGFTRAHAVDIAFNSFYKRYNLDKLPDAISGDVFMALWGTGSKSASIGLLRQILGLNPKGGVDAQLINAAKNYQGDLRNEYLDAREKMFRNGQVAFRKGWLNALDLYRANGCHTIAE